MKRAPPKPRPLPSRLRRGVAGLAVTLACTFASTPSPASAAPPTSGGSEPAAETSGAAALGELRALERDVDAWDLAGARTRLARLPPGVTRDLGAGIVAHLEADYDRAATHLTQVLAQPELDPALRARAERYLGLSRGGQEVFERATTQRSADGLVELVFADPRDAIMAPYLGSVMSRAYERLGEALGVRPEPPVRVELLADPADLSRITPLSLDAVYTTGTVGLCKYRRVMLVTPRAMLFGYGWADTVVHEYTHYLVSVRTRNRAPVWLQEGLAKLYETRWRHDAPLPLEPGRAALLHRAIEGDTLVTLEQMHPSIAMLPSQELAALAYVEVETMLVSLWEKGGDAAIGDLMDRVARGTPPEEAFARAWGTPDASFDDFLAHWRQVWRKRTAGREGTLRTTQFADADTEGEDAERDDLSGDVFSHLGGGRARQLARLGVLLTLRGHRRAAAMEYEKARAADAAARSDPALARRLGQLYLELDAPERALPLLRIAVDDDPENANLLAAHGRALLRNERREEAREALEQALWINPFIPTLHCDLAALAEDAATRAREQAQCRE